MVCPITTKRHAKKWNTEFSWRIFYMSITCQVPKWQYMTFRSLATFRHFEVCTQIKCFFLISIIQLSLNFFFIFENVFLLHASMCHEDTWSLQRLEARIISPGIAVTEDFDTCECLNQNSDPLQEQKILLTFECPFLLLNAFLNIFFLLPMFFPVETSLIFLATRCN